VCLSNVECCSARLSLDSLHRRRWCCRLGGFAIKLAPLPPAKVIAVDVVPDRLELAKKYGATDIMDSREVTDLKAALLAVSDGRGIDGSIDTTGRPDVIGKLLKATAKKGKVVTVGVGKVSTSINFPSV
jgi:aryl-alcohol dehydrogenase